MARLQKQVTEWTILDHAAAHWGAAMTIASVTSALRDYEYGYRETWADLLSELLEGDPHAHAVLKKCYSTIANAKFQIEPPELEDERDQHNAGVIADSVRATIQAIPNWRASVFQLVWGHFSGASALETLWGFDGAEWYVRKMLHVPTRRIDLDDFFRPYLSNGAARTGVLFEDHPGKFLVYLPVVTGDVPTREGLGRIIAFYMAFKRWGVRDYLSYCERYGKPTPLATYKTGRDHADEDDVALCENVVEGLGRGTMPGAWIPDTLTLDFADAASGSGSTSGKDRTVHQSLIDLCNAEISKAVLGNTLTTEVGSTGGNRSLGETQAKDQLENIAAIAKQIDEVITYNLVRWIVRLNFGEDAADKYCPQYVTKLEAPDDLKQASEVLETLVNIGLEVKRSDVHARFGWPMPQDGDDVLAKAPATVMPITEQEDKPEVQEDPADDDDNPEDEGEDEDAPDDGTDDDEE